MNSKDEKEQQLLEDYASWCRVARSSNEYANFIYSRLGRRELLEQLAEECCELAQAALKLIRAAGINRTPKTVDEALSDLHEELTDVAIVLYVFGIYKMAFVDGHYKLKRWAERLGYDAG